MKKGRFLTFTNLLTNVNKKVDLLTWFCRSSPRAEVDLTLYQVNSIVDGKSIKKVDGTTLHDLGCSHKVRSARSCVRSLYVHTYECSFPNIFVRDRTDAVKD